MGMDVHARLLEGIRAPTKLRQRTQHIQFILPRLSRESRKSRVCPSRSDRFLDFVLPDDLFHGSFRIVGS